MSSSGDRERIEKPPTDGLVAGKFALVRLIGRGGMGSVWEARHVTLGTRVAIKFVEVDDSGSLDARRRFETEARAAASIRSKHAIKVYDHGLLDTGRPYIVMELLVGEPLDQRLERVPRLPLAETARLMLQVARALQQAHDAGITHRDLKPENIFLERGADDEDEIAKVLDFGIAKLRDPLSASPTSSSTKGGVLMGTPFYMSPEQARGFKTVDPRSDLWALAIIVFRCVTGALPFDGQSLGDLLVKICAGPIPVPSEVLADVPPAFDAWMRHALDRDPDKRFQSALTMADELAVVAGLEPRLAGRRTESPSTGDWQSPVPAPAAVRDSDLRAFEGLDQPAVAATSSPLTANAVRIPTNGGSGAIAVAALLALGVVAAVGGRAWLAHRDASTAPHATTATVASAPEAPTASASPPVESPSGPAVTTSTPAASSPAVPANENPIPKVRPHPAPPATPPKLPRLPPTPAMHAPPATHVTTPAPPPPPPAADPGY